MPIYEYLCRSCNRIFQFLVKDASRGDQAPPCPRCAAPTERVLSRFSIGGPPTGEGSHAEDADLASLSGEDPRAMASAIRRMADEMGEDLEPEMMEALSRLEAGEDPEQIERDLEQSRPGASPPIHDSGLYEPPAALSSLD
jgi:putative FmdB family regulatory protein